MKTEVAVIGAGVAGLMSATKIAKKGISVVVLEEHSKIGVPCHCAGLVSKRGLRILGIEPEKEFIQNEVRAARFHSPSGIKFEISAERPVAYVIDRIRFDEFLANRAIREGAELKLSSRVVKLLIREGKVEGVKLKGEEIKSKLTLDCEGHSSLILRQTGLKSIKGKLPASQFEVKGEFDPEVVEIFMGRDVAPDFFAYIIPVSHELARIGLASSVLNPRQLLDKFLRKNLKKFKVIKRQSGFILTEGPIARTYIDGFMAIGDCAGQTKPTTGGGIVTGGICSSIASEVAIQAIEENDFSSGMLKSYQKLWKKVLGKEFSIMKLVRRLINKLSDPEIDEIFKLILKKELHLVLEKEGDIDFQSRALLTVLRKLSIHAIQILFKHFIQEILPVS